MIAVFTLVAKSGTAVKDLVVAHTFGRSDAIDAFLIAYLLPSFMLSLVMGSLGSALIPTFMETRGKQGHQQAQRLFSNAMFVSLLALGALTLLLAFFASLYLPVLASGFSAEKLRLTRTLLFVLLPFVLFSGISTCTSALLSAFERFALPSLIPLLTPVVMIAFAMGAETLGRIFARAGSRSRNFLRGHFTGVAA